MAQTNECLMLLPQRNSNVFSELQSFINNMPSESKGMKKSTRDYIGQCLGTCPYVTCNILRLIPTSISNEICHSVIVELLNEFSDSNFNKFLVILMNIKFGDELISRFDIETFQTLLKRLRTRRDIDEKFRLSIAFGPNDRFRDKFLSIEDQQCTTYDLTSKRRIFVSAIVDRKHFIQRLIECDDSMQILNESRESLFLVQMLNNINKLKDHEKCLERINDINMHSTTINCFKKDLFNELKRILHLEHLIISHIPNIRLNSFASKFSVIDVLYENMNFSKIDSQSVLSILAENRKHNDRFKSFGKEMFNQLTEQELFNSYLIVKLLCDVIVDNQHSNVLHDLSVKKLKEVKTLLKNVTTLTAFINTVDISFSLIFLRWDHLPNNRESIDLDRTIESGSESNNTEKFPKRSDKTGFVCSAVVLENILKILKTLSAQKMHSSEFINADDAVKESFVQLHENISDAQWRFSLFSTQPVTAISRSMSFLIEDVKKYFSKHQPNVRQNSNASSDEETNSQRRGTSSVARRKPRRKNHFRKTNGDKNLASNSTEHEQRSDVLNRSMSASERRCFVSKMLGSPAQLATVCLNNSNFEAAKKIIKANNLESSAISQELRFMENYNQTKDKLRDIFNKYDNYDVSSDSNASTVERLKHVALIGFETSKIQSIISTFASEIDLNPSEEVQNLVNKLQRHHPFLGMFNGSSLQATIAVDFIISLTNNYEICFNIFNMLTKLWVDPTSFDDDNSAIGYLKFTKNICECLQLHKSIANNNFGVTTLIYDECDVLRPTGLTVKLEKEKAMNHLNSIQPDVDAMGQLKALLKLFETIRGDVNYFERILNFLVNVMKLLKLQGSNLNLAPTDVLEMDLTELIGEIVFVNEKLPSEISEIIDNLNVNFIHILCVNTMPLIDCWETDYSDVIENLIENVKNCNFQTNGKADNRRTFRINQETLNFIKKNNFLVGYLVHEYNLIKDQTLFYEQKFLRNVMNLDDVKTLAVLHEDNLLISALSYDKFDVRKLEKYLKDTSNYSRLILTSKIPKFENIASVAIPKAKVTKAWVNERNAIRMIQSCSERSFRKRSEKLKALQDALIKNCLKESSNNYDLIEHISDINVRSEYLLGNIQSIESSGMIGRLIKSILLHQNVRELQQSLKSNLTTWLRNINIYDAIAEKTQCRNWIETRDLSVNSPELILKQLMDLREFDLCLSWLHMHPLKNCLTKFSEFCKIFKETVTTSNETNFAIFKIIESLPLNVAVDFYDNLLNGLQDLDFLDYIIDFLVRNSTRTFVYQKYQISLKIFSQMNADEQENNWTLFNTPLMIIEQYLMNSRYDTMSLTLNSIKPLLIDENCKYCYARRNSSYDTKSSSNPDFRISLSENDFGHRDHSLSSHCINSLLKVYASKALDFRVSESHSQSSNELLSQSMASLDSLCGSFVMPKVAPDRLHWVKDEDAVHCMCCKRSVFTMLTRRHHCRRCGRVVCHVCSTKRIEIPELYADVKVRSCDDCFKQIESNKQRKSPSQNTAAPTIIGKKSDELTVWQFSGNAKHDNLLREEFCFEYAPSVSLCLSILKFHSSDSDCVDFLLYHCRKFESLLRPIQPGYPNPEIDYALVTRMMHCLALAAKVRGGPPECDTVRDHGEIIQAIVSHGCESLMPMESPNSVSFRKLRDSLVLAEKWSLALELSLKCGFATTGVMAAWGIACLRAGCFDTAREKFGYCLNKTSDDNEIYQITSLLLHESADDLMELTNIPKIKRPPKNPPLLDEILNILEVSCHSHQPEVLARASVIKDSNTSLASNRSRKREQIPLHEPALNVLHTLLTLKQVTRGIYEGSDIDKPSSVTKKASESIVCWKLIKCPRFYDECIYYLTRYGSHNGILAFLIKNEQLSMALKYFLCQNVDADAFINVIFLPYLSKGKVDVIIELMLGMDQTLLLWKSVIIKTCRYLEHKGLLNSLYHLQILLKDPVRASMTCVKFYSMNSSSYRELQNNSFHLMNAQKHLQNELELCQWEEISVSTKIAEDVQSILMKMDSRTLNSHINTIWRQIEVTKFLAKCEQDGRDTVILLPKISADSNKIPTLFGTIQDKIQLAVLTIICGCNIDEGFGLAFRIIQDFNLSPIKVYGITAKYLSANNRLQNVEKLIENIKSNSDCGGSFCDEIISVSIQTAVATIPLNAQNKPVIDSLVRLVNDVGVKISCHIIGGQLKSAYLLAVQYNRFNDIKKVLRKAEQTNQQHIKKLCEKKLNIQH